MKKGRGVDKVLEYRKTGDDTIKKQLPLATISGVCKGGRSRENVVERTGWIALDIDAKGNPHLANWELVRDTVAKIRYVAFSALSVSGKGVWALVKVKDPGRQKEYFQQLQRDFESRGIILDSSKGKNPNDARFYSYDPDAKLTTKFTIYDRLPGEKDSSIHDNSYSLKKSCDRRDQYDIRFQVEALIKKIKKQRIDITEGYQNWRNLGFALESEFGEEGRQYFHAISQFYPNYSPGECDKQYSRCLNHKGRGITIRTFFHRCKEYDITFDHNH